MKRVDNSAHMMIFKNQILFYIGVILMMSGAQALEFEMFVAENRRPMEEYVMTGYGYGWKHCDILSAKTQEADFNENIPHFAIAVDKLLTIDLGSTLSSAHCVLAIYDIDNVKQLGSVIKFGWKMILIKRIALLLRLGSGLTLDNPINMTRVPFPIAAELGNGLEQFICPFIGEDEPIFQEQMCKKSFLSLEGKTLRICFTGHDLVGEDNVHINFLPYAMP